MFQYAQASEDADSLCPEVCNVRGGCQIARIFHGLPVQFVPDVAAWLVEQFRSPRFGTRRVIRRGLPAAQR